MTMIRWKPVADIDELFEDIYLKAPDLSTDVYEEDGNIVIEMHVPGFDMENIDIEVHDDFVKIMGVRKEEKEKKAKHYFRKEIRRGNFERMISLPSKVAVDKAQAEITNGTLKVTLPKSAGRQPQKLKIHKK